jgi:hypothetical protein
MSTQFASKTRDKHRAEVPVDKSAAAEFAMSLASTLLLGSQARGELEPRPASAVTKRTTGLRRSREAAVYRRV